ncbi:sensor histidine kinase [Sphingopyxis alaskensis]|uniref:histidine kinase n=1 Tax=Sphingopyxis alaskensis (strain DSM 13593 / LMG 18877 / RB2256) TaxID=317655 RepID=Q1GWG1_SPHAL|nr:GAF domain-containing protein [Sphingopyxis alaskensis]ABF52011.1 signal transduction histidine kinase [Sphingopyxis alaskensis RB2256]
MAERPPGEMNDAARATSATRGGRDLPLTRDGRTERERRRVETLREYHLLDTGAEAAFDRVTKLVADLFDAPIALISLVDDCRQWFKSAHGLDVPETPRDISFCKHVVEDEQPLIVGDAASDPRFQDNPLVTGEPYIRFYGGVPLFAYNGAILGTLCIIDRKPRPALSFREVERLQDFAALVMAEADLRRIVGERDEARRMLEQALDFSGIATWRYDARTGAIHWSGAVAELWGADYATALAHIDGFFDRLHPDDREAVRGVLGESVAHGGHYATEYRIQHPERGVRWIAVHADWDVRTDDAILTGVSMDITEQKSRQENANLLMRELHHRMRNLFATVGAIISLTRHAARDVDDYVERISSRLDALNRAQNVLLGANFMTGSMHALLREVEASFPRIHWSGPDLLLPENALVAMALLFNELATNAAKHGALSGERGQVEVRWTQDDEGADDRRFRLTWAESGADREITPPERTSFGTLLMERSVRNNLGGTIARRWEPGGLIVDITLPARWREA